MNTDLAMVLLLLAGLAHYLAISPFAIAGNRGYSMNRSIRGRHPMPVMPALAGVQWEVTGGSTLPL